MLFNVLSEEVGHHGFKSFEYFSVKKAPFKPLSDDRSVLEYTRTLWKTFQSQNLLLYSKLLIKGCLVLILIELLPDSYSTRSSSYQQSF